MRAIHLKKDFATAVNNPETSPDSQITAANKQILDIPKAYLIAKEGSLLDVFAC